MINNIDSINKLLAEAQWEWYEEICKPWMCNNKNVESKLPEWIKKKYPQDKSEAQSISYSEPFCTAIINNVDIMFVGQETNGYGSINNFNEKDSVEKSQEWLKQYLKENFDPVGEKNISYNRYPFVDTMRKFSRNYGVCWNNVDKINYRTENIKCIKLYESDEKELNKKIKKYNCSLLMQEIKIIKPKFIIFAIGRAYKSSLFEALSVKLTEDHMPSSKEFVGKPFHISNGSGEDSLCFWTYHPRYCMRKNIDPYEKIRQVIEQNNK